MCLCMFERAHASEAATDSLRCRFSGGGPSSGTADPFIYLPLVLISYFPDLTKYVRQAAQQDPGIRLSNWDCKTLGFVYMNSWDRT